MSYFFSSSELPLWIGKPPTGWRSDWLKWNVGLSTARPTEEEAERLPYIANEDIASWTGKLLRDDPQPAEADSRKFQTDDILFNKLRPYLAKVFHAQFNGTSSGELLCLRPASHVLPRFLFYVTSSKAFVDAVNAETFGSKMPRADWEIVGHQPLPLPPLDVQRRIVALLDKKTAQIDGLIARKTELLARLAEKRQAIITQAVTKGLNPDAPMKYSGIDWLGQIPAHWELRRLKFNTSKIGSGVTPRGGASVYVDEGVMFLRSQNIHFDGLQLDDVAFIEPEVDDEMAYTRVYERDVLLNITGASIGRCCVYDRPHLSANVNQHVCIVRPTADLSSGFLAMYLASPMGQIQIDLSQNGASREGLNFDDLSNFIVTVPKVQEQAQIASFLDHTVQTLKLQIAKINESITSLLEYRSALITAAVTGQIEGFQ